MTVVRRVDTLFGPRRAASQPDGIGEAGATPRVRVVEKLSAEMAMEHGNSVGGRDVENQTVHDPARSRGVPRPATRIPHLRAEDPIGPRARHVTAPLPSMRGDNATSPPGGGSRGTARCHR